jgi:3'(2'), 5'-bisphosphate nucleotidase
MLELPFSGALPETMLAIEAALQAGKKVIEIYGSTDFQVTEKQDRSPVTIADIASNTIIERVLSRSQIPMLSEEGREEYDGVRSSVKRRIWIIDPLDGTKEFVEKNGEFTIMIGLVDNHSPLIGVIYSPVEDSLHVAEKGKGAYRYNKGKWQGLKVSNIGKIKDARAVLSRSHVSDEELGFLRDLNVRSFSRLGSSLKILSICSGSAEIYFTATRYMKQWDTCASYCLLTEAGGRMTDLYGNELQYDIQPLNHEKGIVATNGFLHDQVVDQAQLLREILDS